MEEVQALTHRKMSKSIPARELYICWIEDPQYWVWTHLKDCSRTEVAELLKVCWLDIKGKLDVKNLPSHKKLGAYLVFKLREESYGLERVKTSITFTKDKCDCEDAEVVTACLDNKKKANACAVVPHLRTDGWLEIKIGSDFSHNCGDHGEVEMRVYETDNYWKSGLLVKEIEVRPTF